VRDRERLEAARVGQLECYAAAVARVDNGELAGIVDVE
jgi:hypothetical protein